MTGRRSSITAGSTMLGKTQTIMKCALAPALILVCGLVLRTAGLFSGLDSLHEYHPDVPKQIRQLSCYVSGNYTAHYGGDPFYDGYPYGFNRVDEVVIRLVRPVLLAVRHQFVPDVQMSNVPDTAELYYWTRCIRVLSGMIVVLLAYSIGRLLGLPRWGALLASLMVAIAPLSITVSHMATGDIGVDLFVGLTFLFMCRMIRTDRPGLPLVLAGCAVGFAFASKYHGLLVAWVPFVFFLWRCVGDRAPGRFLGVFIVLATSFVVAVVIVNPAYLVYPLRTWHDTVAEAVFIKNYHVSKEYLAQPLVIRIGESFQSNTAVVCGALGWGVVVMGILGLILAAKATLASTGTAQGREIPVLRLALFSFPVVAGAVSMATKPNLQPFHFSFLELPLTLSAAYAATELFGKPSRVVRSAAAIAVIVTLMEVGSKALSDNYFWNREEIGNLAGEMRGTLVYSDKQVRPQNDTVRELVLEPDNVSVFRNRPADVAVAGGALWNMLHIPPVPCIAYPGSHDWIFMNGPVLPRSDRMFKVAGDTLAERTIVYYSEPGSLILGIRSGFRPVDVIVKACKSKRIVGLPPDSSGIIMITEPGSRRIDKKHGDRSSDVFLCPISVKASYGDAWVTVLGDKRETDNFRVFSGNGGSLSDINVTNGCSAEQICALVDSARYLEGSLLWRKMPCGESYKILDDALPAGRYLLDVEAVPLLPDTRIRAVCKDMFDREIPVAGDDLTNVVSVSRAGMVTIELAKTFAPYQVRIELECVSGSCLINGWRLRPDTKRIIADLASCTNVASEPAWLRIPGRSRQPSYRDKFSGTVFGGKIELDDVSLPATVRPGANELFLSIRMKALMLREVEKHQIFLHFADAAGKHKGAAGIMLPQALCAARLGESLAYTLPDGLAPGEYDVWMGIYTVESGKRMNIAIPAAKDSRKDADNRLSIGRTAVVPTAK
jgi:hypothetical protein